MQKFFTRAPLNEAGILDTYQRLLSAQINHTGAMLSVDDTSFVKKETNSIGVKRQYCGSLGKREICQVGVFLSYAGDSGYGLVDYDLYIPEEWFQAPYQDLRTRCRLPEHKRFLTKNQIVQGLQLFGEFFRHEPEPADCILWRNCDRSAF